MNSTTAATTTIPTTIGRIMRKGAYPMTAAIAEGNRTHADMAQAMLEHYGYTSSSAISVDQYHTELERVVSVCGHDNGATIVLVNPIAIIPAMIVDRVTGLTAPWGYIWEDDLV